MRLRFVEEAAAEFLDGISYYEKKQPGLGRRFKTDIEHSLIWLSKNPEVCHLRQGGYPDLTCEFFLITFLTY